MQRTTIEGKPPDYYWEGLHNAGVYAAYSTKIQDNPEIEIYANQVFGTEFELPEPIDLYGFPLLLMSDIGLPRDNASLTLYKFAERSDVYDENSPWYHPDMEVEIMKFVQHLTVTMRVRHISEATFKYYRSLLLQSDGVDLFTEPVTIQSNIQNGYGSFGVFNATDIQLLDYVVTKYGFFYGGE
jgi:hypothetical protein